MSWNVDITSQIIRAQEDVSEPLKAKIEELEGILMRNDPEEIKDYKMRKSMGDAMQAHFREMIFGPEKEDQDD